METGKKFSDLLKKSRAFDVWKQLIHVIPQFALIYVYFNLKAT